MYIFYLGVSVGTPLGMGLSGVLVKSYGWPLPFYCFGSLGVLWFLPWLYYVYSTPRTHPRIGPREKEHILSQMSSETLKGEVKKGLLVKIWRQWNRVWDLPGVVNTGNTSSSLAQHLHVCTSLGAFRLQFWDRMVSLHDDDRVADVPEKYITLRRPAGNSTKIHKKKYHFAQIDIIYLFHLQLLMSPRMEEHEPLEYFTKFWLNP